jgi:hypothetical protein
LNIEDAIRLQEFKDWFPELRSVRLQIGFRGGTAEMLISEENVMKTVMKFADVFHGIEVLLFVEPCEEPAGSTLLEVLEGIREKPPMRPLKNVKSNCLASRSSRDFDNAFIRNYL